MGNRRWRLQAEQILNPVKFFILDLFSSQMPLERNEFLFWFGFLQIWSFKKYCEIFNK